jgi:CheY-like chemotaxis protein/anti-sigma regulatory factor (Ser/Thr protein kinase)
VARILTIDDDPSVLSMVSRLLSTEGHEVATAPDGTGGIEKAREFRPDLILCDIVMPDPNGFEVLAALRRDPTTSAIPLIFLTGVPDPTELRPGAALGADDYLLKPFTRDELVHAIDARLARLSFARREARSRVEALTASLEGSLPRSLLSPVAAIVGLSAFLRDEGATVPPELVCEIANGILDGSRRLEARLEKLLTYASLERLVQASRTARTREGGRTDDAAALIRRVAKETAVSFSRDADLASDVENGVLRLDPEHLGRLVSELTDNALRFSPSGTPVTVTCRRDGDDSFRLVVRDRGPGIPEAVLTERPGCAGLGTEDDRSGFGLPIARRICRLYGTILVVERAAEGGSTVSAKLPSS